MAKRNFSDNDTPTKSDDYHGNAIYVRSQPDIAVQGVKSVNIELSFEDALRLSLAIQSAVLNLNRFNRATVAGREMGMLLSLKTETRTITVIEKRVRAEPVEWRRSGHMNNQTLQWTGPASGVLVIWKPVGAVPAIERWSVIPVVRFAAIIVLCIVAAVIYGVVHDQITARICVEYFTIGHPPVFGTDDPTLLGLGWGVIATWWVGLILGVLLALSSRVGSWPQLSAKQLVRPLAIC
jgi:hypothetical protein